jgi:hypothetical protein
MKTVNNPIKIDVENSIKIILKLLSPFVFKSINSFFLKRSKKRNCVEIKKIKGKISNKVIGDPKIVNKYGYIKFALIFLKNEISSKILKIIIKHKKIKLIKINLLKKFLIKYLE